MAGSRWRVVIFMANGLSSNCRKTNTLIPHRLRRSTSPTGGAAKGTSDETGSVHGANQCTLSAEFQKEIPNHVASTKGIFDR